MKYLISALCAIIITMAFTGRKCQHVFTQVEQATVKIERPRFWECAVYTAPPTGLHEGDEIICVKCFHKQKQILDYGKPPTQTNDQLNGLGSFLCDTVRSAITSGRILTIRGGSK